MAAYKIVLFDLDGTLTDPKVGITKSIQYALAKMDINEPELARLIPFIGPPLLTSFKEHYGFDDQKAWQAVTYYREYFATQGIYENSVYPGIRDLLAALFQAGTTLIAATSKPTVYAAQILSYFALAAFFSRITGSNLDGTRTDKTELITYIMAGLGETNKGNVVMVGDRKYDIIGARNAGIDAIAVAYGYGSLAELAQEQPTFVAKSVAELTRILEASV